MTKDEALKMAIDYLGGSYEAHKVRKACQEALEQPSVAELNDEYLHYTYVAGLTQPQYLNVYGYLENQNITFRQQNGMPYLGKIKLETNDD